MLGHVVTDVPLVAGTSTSIFCDAISCADVRFNFQESER